MEKIEKKLKDSQDRKTFYAKKNRVFRDLKVGEHIFLKFKEKISSIRFVFFQKLKERYCGTLEILENIGPIAYMIAFPTSK
jgi:hypothetical protein